MFEYCKSCTHDDDIGFCDKCYYNHILEEKGIPPTEYEAKPKPQTNADRIRSMSDEELAKWIYDVSITDGFCPYDNTREPCITHNFECVPCITDWLKEEEGE